MVREREEPVVPAGSALVDPAAREKLEAAAAAAGMTISELADLIVDSGAIALPATNRYAVSKTLSLGELGKRMWGELQQVASPDRSEWFNALLEPQKVALIVGVSERGYRAEIIAKDLGIPVMRVREVIDQYADRVGAQVTQMRLSTIAGHVQIAAERAMEGLLQDGDFKGYFGIQKDVVKILQSLGIIDQAIHRVEVTHKMEDNAKAEIDAMLELERKQQRRLEEIERSQRIQVDEVPQLDFEKEA